MTPIPNPVNNLPTYNNEAICSKVKVTRLNQKSLIAQLAFVKAMASHPAILGIAATISACI